MPQNEQWQIINFSISTKQYVKRREIDILCLSNMIQVFFFFSHQYWVLILVMLLEFLESNCSPLSQEDKGQVEGKHEVPESQAAGYGASSSRPLAVAEGPFTGKYDANVYNHPPSFNLKQYL